MRAGPTAQRNESKGEMTETNPQCPRCGVAVQPTWDWCHECGFHPDAVGAIGAAPPPPPPPPPPSAMGPGPSFVPVAVPREMGDPRAIDPFGSPPSAPGATGPTGAD